MKISLLTCTTDFSPNNMTYLRGYTRENQPSTAIIMNIG